MDYRRLKYLLEKYWEGKTTIAEESEIAHLLQDTSNDEFKKEKEYFQFLSEERMVSTTKSMSHSKPKSVRNDSGSKRARLWNILKIAASISIIAIAGYVLFQDMEENEEQLTELTDTFDDPQKAFEETKKALMLISENIGKGRKEASKLGAFNEVEKRLKSKEETKK